MKFKKLAGVTTLLMTSMFGGTAHAAATCQIDQVDYDKRILIAGANNPHLYVDEVDVKFCGDHAYSSDIYNVNSDGNRWSFEVDKNWMEYQDQTCRVEVWITFEKQFPWSPTQETAHCNVISHVKSDTFD